MSLDLAQDLQTIASEYDDARKAVIRQYATPSRRGATKAQRLAMADLPRRICAQCGETYQPLKKDQSFCCATCRKTFHKIRALLGPMFFDIVIAWRMSKGAKGTFTEMSRAVDKVIREHRHELGHAVSNGKAGFGRMSRRKS